jgi:hypothetical protein
LHDIVSPFLWVALLPAQFSLCYQFPNLMEPRTFRDFCYGDIEESRMIKSIIFQCLIIALLAASTVYADGNVKVTVTPRGDVELSGDAADNAVDIMAVGPGRIELWGIDTNLNETLSPITLSYSRNLKLKMGKGNDSVLIKGDLPGGLAIDNKGGNDTTKFYHDVADPVTTIHGDISLKGRHGNNWLELRGLDINGKVSVYVDDSVYDGKNLLLFNRSKVFGDVTMKSRRGDSQLSIGTSMVHGNVKFEAGKGKDSNLFNLSSHNYVFGNVKVKLGDGEDSVYGVMLDIEGKAEFDFGNGDDEFYTEGLQVGKNLRIKTGKGMDYVYFGHQHQFKTRGRVNGNTHITGDEGDDVISLKSSDFAGDLAVVGGKGTDTFKRDVIIVGGREKIKNF